MHIEFTVIGNPITKKNSQRMVSVYSNKTGKNRMIPIPSSQYESYMRDFMWQVPYTAKKQITDLVNLKCVYYMGVRRKVDLVNLLEATQDILVASGVIQDDNCFIVHSTDGSRVCFDKENPRVEITIDTIDD